MEFERIKQIKARIQGIINHELCMEEDQEHWKSHHIADHIFDKLKEDGELLDDRKDDVTVIITDSDWRRLNHDLLISSTYSTMRSMIVRWIKSLGLMKDERGQINISDVNELASYVTMDSYYDRRNLILIWLKRFGVPVYGGRQRGNRRKLEKMTTKMRKVWKGEPIDARFMDRYS